MFHCVRRFRISRLNATTHHVSTIVFVICSNCDCSHNATEMSLVYLLHVQFCVPHYFCKDFAMHFRSRYALCRQRNKSVSCKPAFRNLSTLSLECNAKIVLHLQDWNIPHRHTAAFRFPKSSLVAPSCLAQCLVLREFLIPQIPRKRCVVVDWAKPLAKALLALRITKTLRQ